MGADRNVDLQVHEWYWDFSVITKRKRTVKSSETVTNNSCKRMEWESLAHEICRIAVVKNLVHNKFGYHNFG